MDRQRAESLVSEARVSLEQSGVSDFVEVDEPSPGDSSQFVECEDGSVWVKAWVLVGAKNG